LGSLTEPPIYLKDSSKRGRVAQVFGGMLILGGAPCLAAFETLRLRSGQAMGLYPTSHQGVRSSPTMRAPNLRTGARGSDDAKLSSLERLSAGSKCSRGLARPRGRTNDVSPGLRVRFPSCLFLGGCDLDNIRVQGCDHSYGVLFDDSQEDARCSLRLAAMRLPILDGIEAKAERHRRNGPE